MLDRLPERRFAAGSTDGDDPDHEPVALRTVAGSKLQMTSNPRRRSDRGGSAASIPDQAGSEPGRVADQRPLARRRIRRADQDLDRRRGRTTKRAKAGEDDACIGEAGELAPAPLLATVEGRTLKAARQQAAPPLARYSSSIAWLATAPAPPRAAAVGSRVVARAGRRTPTTRRRRWTRGRATSQPRARALPRARAGRVEPARRPRGRSDGVRSSAAAASEPVPGLPHAQRCGRDPGAFRELTDRYHERRIEIFLQHVVRWGE